MEIGEILWILVWFLAGLFTFQITSLKGILTFLSATVTAISILALAFDLGGLMKWIAHYPVDYIGGALSNLSYLIGANLVRGDQFHTETLWLRIFLYGITMVLLITLLKMSGPFKLA